MSNSITTPESSPNSRIRHRRGSVWNTKSARVQAESPLQVTACLGFAFQEPPERKSLYYRIIVRLKMKNHQKSKTRILVAQGEIHFDFLFLWFGVLLCIQGLA